MSLKQFNADVRAACSRLYETSIPGVVAIERGDSEGEVIVTLTHAEYPKPLHIRLLAQNVDEYPDGNTFLLFMDSDDVSSSTAAILEDLQHFTFGQKVIEAISTLSTGIQLALNRLGADGDTEIGETAGPGLPHDRPEDSDDEEIYEYFDDEEFGLASTRSHGSMAAASRMTSDIMRRVRSDLRKAREAGCKVGVLGGLLDSSRKHILSLSLRASKLGLSQEALEAWDLDPSDYIVLLLRIDDTYPSADKVTEQSSVNFNIQFRFGKCTRYKPSLEQTMAAFAPTGGQTSSDNTFPPTEDDNLKFHKIFISNSLEQFMNESFVSLVKLRLRGCATWDEANAELRSMSSTFCDEQAKDNEEETTNHMPATGAEGSAMETPGPSGSGPTSEYHNAPKVLPAILLYDSFVEPETSLPLIAMQFAIHYFIRCTEYCLRCHRRIDKEFEALKPFVCSDPLCLFQYIAMGLGPSIEHEIITQPYVVDLLVSLCYSSVQNQPPGGLYRPISTRFPIRDFPSGLRLKVPSILAGEAVAEVPITVNFDIGHKVALFSSVADIDRIPAGSWVVLRHDVQPPDGQLGRTRHKFHHHHAYVKYVDRQTSTFAVDMKHWEPFTSSKVNDGTINMDVHPYNKDFDDLSEAGKARAMVSILDTLPPIAHIREYLIKNPQSTLRSYPDVSPAAATLLYWIVASNRSYIFQVSPVADLHARDKDLLATVKTRDQEAIPSMNSCVQFRFAQGAPDKELRFNRALRDLKAQKQTDFPTLFAWHGSGLANWHSILRQGLDFSQVTNGRAFGNGVYFSQDFGISTVYAARGIAGSSWPKSALNGSGVISLCEIVNAPEEFVSTNPHLVVNQVDWIQCRYLFVQSIASTALPTCPAEKGDVAEVLQDPARSVKGPDGNVLRIPLKAIPSRRVAHHPKKQPSVLPSSKRTHEMADSSGDSDDEDEADLEYLFSSDDEGSGPPLKRLNSESARDSSVDTAMTCQVTARRPLTPPQSDFRPGTLDLDTLPRLPVPNWANPNSTKRLTSDIKHMQKAQASTPLHELGWYIDFDKVDNMFQWIVELHSFDPSLSLAKDMKEAGVTSVVLEVRFGREYPFSPPFIRVIRPRFLPFASGGGGHVTIGGAVCMELLTSTGWSPVTSMEAVFLSVRMSMSETEPAARLETTQSSARMFDYGANEALDAYVRFANTHGWKVPSDLRETAGQVARLQ